MGSSGFYRVLPSITGRYLVEPGLTGFLRAVDESKCGWTVKVHVCHLARSLICLAKVNDTLWPVLVAWLSLTFVGWVFSFQYYRVLPTFLSRTNKNKQPKVSQRSFASGYRVLPSFSLKKKCNFNGLSFCIRLISTSTTRFYRV